MVNGSHPYLDPPSLLLSHELKPVRVKPHSQPVGSHREVVLQFAYLTVQRMRSMILEQRRESQRDLDFRTSTKIDFITESVQYQLEYLTNPLKIDLSPSTILFGTLLSVSAPIRWNTPRPLHYRRGTGTLQDRVPFRASSWERRTRKHIQVRGGPTIPKESPT